MKNRKRVEERKMFRGIGRMVLGVVVCLGILVLFGNYMWSQQLEFGASFEAEKFCATKYRLVQTRVDEPDRMIVTCNSWKSSHGKESYSIDSLGNLHVIEETVFVSHPRDAEEIIFYKSHPRWNELYEKIKPGLTVSFRTSSPGKADKKNWVNYLVLWHVFKGKAD